ncbi:MAG: hypothetical protein KY442_09110 [Proteobacteria bacterium]|nr:hypothetical protein [Pseudomonadota bacterium]
MSVLEDRGSGSSVLVRLGFTDIPGTKQALRELGLWRDGRPVDDSSPCAASLPDVVAVRMNAEVLELVLTAPYTGSAPAPWVVAEDGLRWSVGRDADLGVERDRRHAADRFAPYPGLVTVGHTGAGEHYLIDLERIGALSLTGDRQRCLDLARFVAAELAHNRWSDFLQVDVVGFGAELAELNPSRLVHRSAADAAAAVRPAGGGRGAPSCVVAGCAERRLRAGRVAGGGDTGSGAAHRHSRATRAGRPFRAAAPARSGALHGSGTVPR